MDVTTQQNDCRNSGGFASLFAGRTARALRDLGFLPFNSDSASTAPYINTEKTHFPSQNPSSQPPTPTTNPDALIRTISPSDNPAETVPTTTIEHIPDVETISNPATLPSKPDTEAGTHSSTNPLLAEPFHAYEKTPSNSAIASISDVGIDTMSIILPLEPGMICTDHRLQVTRSRHDRGNRLLFIDSAGECVEGKKATSHQDNGLDIRIYPAKRHQVLQNRSNPDVLEGGTCIIQFSVARLNGFDDNTHPANKAGTLAALEQVQKILTRTGIHADIMDGILIRVDLFRNLVAREKCAYFQQVFNGLHAGYKTKAIYETGSHDTNKSECISIYDKRRERLDKGRNVDGMPENVLRIELQEKKSPKIKKVLGVRTVRELVEGFEQLPDGYTTGVTHACFRHDPAEFETARVFRESPVQHQVKTIFKGLKTRGVTSGLTRLQIQSTIEHKGADALAAKLKAVPGIDKKWLSTHIRALKNAILREAGIHDPEFGRRYIELREAIGVVAMPDIERSCRIETAIYARA